MNKHYIFLGLIFIFLSLSSFSQNATTISGKITNEFNETIKDVRITTNLSNSFYRSNKKGEYSFAVEKFEKFTITFYHAGYARKRIRVDKSEIKGNKIQLNVVLKINTLPQAVIEAKKKPKVVFGNKTTSIADYEFIGDYLIILAYEKSLKKDGYLQLTNKKNTLITQFKTPSRPKRLFKDFQNAVYLITEYKVYSISIFKNEFRLRPIDKDEFYRITTRIIDTTSNHFLYSDFNPNYPAFNYYAQVINDTTTKNIHYVENNFMMDLYRAEYKYAPNKDKLWAFRQELVTGIDKEIWIGAANFTQSIYYEPLYAPLFVNNDTTLIFDHYNDYLYKFDSEFNKFDSIPIAYHKNKEKKNWEQPIIKDKDEHKMYVLFLKNGYYYLKPINLEDGSTSYSFKLAYKYVENVKIENGFVYYIYRPYESSQKKYLYREIVRTI